MREKMESLQLHLAKFEEDQKSNCKRNPMESMEKIIASLVFTVSELSKKLDAKEKVET